MSTPLVQVENLKKSFGTLEVLKGINFTAEKGSVTVIIGPSGTGKSTFLRCLNYLEKPDAGAIEIAGKRLVAGPHSERELLDFRKKTAMVFQNYHVFKNKTVLENVLMPMVKVQKKPHAVALERAKELLHQVGLDDKLEVYPSRLSGGQQQRVGIARALAVDPEVLLFDEPTSSLDPELVGGILQIIGTLAKEHQRTMIIVTHEMRFAMEVADEVVMMDEGRILERQTPKSMLAKPLHERTRRFIQQSIGGERGEE